jgi:hypothetical protein
MNEHPGARALQGIKQSLLKRMVVDQRFFFEPMSRTDVSRHPCNTLGRDEMFLHVMIQFLMV